MSIVQNLFAENVLPASAYCQSEQAVYYQWKEQKQRFIIQVIHVNIANVHARQPTSKEKKQLAYYLHNKY